MHYKYSTMLQRLTTIALAASVWSTQLLAEQVPQSAIIPVSKAASALEREPGFADLETKIVRIGAVQEQQIATLHSSNENYKFLISGFGVLLTALVVAQSYLAYRQFKREGAGVQHVNEIMKVLKETLQSRLDAEGEARKEADRATKELADLKGITDKIAKFVTKFQENIIAIRQAIEDQASSLAQRGRHDFRQLPDKLTAFAREFDAFQNEYLPLEEGQQPAFTARVTYIRGIAAHYTNEPKLARDFFDQVIKREHPESGEPDGAYIRRVANANYYIGISEFNFGNTQNAMDAFAHAADLDPGNADFLTRIVTAEVQVMAGSDGSSKAEKMLIAVEQGIEIERARPGPLQSVYLRLLSRAKLIRAGIAFRSNKPNWAASVQELIGPVYHSDSSYYYATATLAQSYAEQKISTAANLFAEAYDAIRDSGDLLTVTEVRSKILLHVVSALCCRNGPEKLHSKFTEHLDQANRLCDDLPQMNGKFCTVFSPLSKVNETRETIRAHIDLIRTGRWRV